MPKNILIITDGWIHPPITARFWLSYALTQPGSGYQFKNLRSLEAISSMDLSPFQGMVLYFHHKRISDAALDAFDNFVTGGGGALAIHSATASFKGQDRFTNILGGKFIGHGPVERFEIKPVPAVTPIFAGIPAFSIKDERYIHDLQPDIETHFSTIYKGQPAPMVWTCAHGAGRVCYVCPGHRAAIFKVPEIRDILAKGLAWACAPNL